jgi:hypothetical protein
MLTVTPGADAMRFSLKWLLIGMVYVAVAAASFSFAERTWIYGEILHAMTMLAFVYAVLMWVVKRGNSQLVAAGFALASGYFMLNPAYSNPRGTPAAFILESAGLEPVDDSSSPYYRPHDDSVWTTFYRRLRAANAVATLAFGLLGSLIGLLACPRAARGVV